MLAVRDVTLRFGGVTALNSVSFDVAEGEICALIGPNGAGKTSLFNVISGLYLPDEGSISYLGGELLREPRHRRARRHISRTFQNVALFEGLTVLENTMVGTYSAQRTGFLRAMFRTPGFRSDEAESRRASLEVLHELGVADVASERVSELPYGLLKKVELARAVVGRPRLLLLDEPAAGLNDAESGELETLLSQIASSYQATILIVEHHMQLVMALADHVVALDFGRKIADGTARDVASDARVIAAYLGGAA